MVFKFWKISLVFATLLCGCGGGDNTVTPVVNPNDPTVRSVPRSTRGLEFVLSVPKKTFKVGEAITFTTTIRNTTYTPISMALSTYQSKDSARVAIYDSNNAFVDFAPSYVNPDSPIATYLPGMPTNYPQIWPQMDLDHNQQVPTGEYHAFMRLQFGDYNGRPVPDTDRDKFGSETIYFTIQ